MNKEVYIAAALRTPVAKARGAFATVRPDDLLSHVIAGVLKAVPQVDSAKIGDVIVGCAMPEAEQGMNVARIASLLAGVPENVPAMTINRFCASGLQAIALAADKIRQGEASMMIAAGVESMTRVPMGGHTYLPNPQILNADHEGIAYSMGITAEKVAERFKISREAQDAFALQSHERALEAIQAGTFSAEILPYSYDKRLPNLKTGEIMAKTVTVENDTGPRASTLEGLAHLRPVFSARGSVTAGNTSQMSDGAAALLLVDKDTLMANDLTPLGRFVSYQVAGVSPEYMGIGPVEAVPKALKQAGISLQDVDWIELNEAFAAQALAVMQELSLDPEKTNPQGGAIALGHPLGATGAIRATTLLHGMRQRHQRYGMVSMCIGTGMGAAGIFESL